MLICTFCFYILEQMDDLLNFCFACALKSKIKKNDLPLLTGNLLRNYMQPFR